MSPPRIPWTAAGSADDALGGLLAPAPETAPPRRDIEGRWITAPALAYLGFHQEFPACCRPPRSAPPSSSAATSSGCTKPGDTSIRWHLGELRGGLVDRHGRA
ncbi:hypothetical protein [Actinacidiphila soli]|uniref:hypothetical protein n=1 Tax=Actinacidiphila soli TaxID=2487275 RepID=UPI000FCAA0AE|nr:hypothetical protein [Actinacidiphila soli]